ncbi:MAG TPA: carbohydrate kinase [Mobilitalea sp.]|nr:carbohydrate kinase [Mobilitalea sp.]
MGKYEIDVVALGELLMDFTVNGVSEQGNLLFEANPGGAPCNVLSMLSKLRYKTSFIGKVGDDLFGRRLKGVLEELKIGTENLMMDAAYKTTLAFVHTAADGDRDFSFYRKPGADMMLKESELDSELITSTRIFHIGSLSMTDEPVYSATRTAIEKAKEKGVLISFDPNLRIPLWDNLALAKQRIEYGLSVCDILKISEEELEFITGYSTIEEGVAALKREYKIALITVTLGKYGSKAYYKDFSVTGAPFLRENVVDTTGAGDTFCACILHFVLAHGIEKLTAVLLANMLMYANAAASLITSKKGSLYVMPEEREILELMQTAEG